MRFFQAALLLVVFFGFSAQAATSPTKTTHGKCGIAQKDAVVFPPADNLCDAGAAGAVSLAGGSYNWSCIGSGKNARTVACAAPQIPFATLTPKPAAALLGGIGMNVHLNKDNATVAAGMRYLGLDTIRAGVPDPKQLKRYVDLAKQGIKLNLIVRAGKIDVARDISMLEQLQAQVPGSVTGIEGFNEINNWPPTYGDLKGLDAALKAQGEVYRAAQASRSLKDVPVIDFTGPGNGVAGMSDYNNRHSYPQFGQQPRLWLRAKQLPSYITEFGYFSTPQAGSLIIGVDETSQAKMLLNGVVDSMANGIEKTFLYELFDNGANSRFGLLRTDSSPKPAAAALHNLSLILGNDRGNLTRPATLSIAIDQLPATANTLLLQHSDGRHFLIVWNEPKIWDPKTGKAVAAPVVPVTLHFSEARRVTIYDPMLKAAPVRASSGAVKTLALDLVDHPLVLELR